MIAIYREIILMFVNYSTIYLELHQYQLYFFKTILDTPSYNCMYIYCHQNQVWRPVKIVHKNVL